MPKKFRRARNRRKGRGAGIISVKCEFLVNVALTSGIGLFTVGSGALTNSARFVAMQSCYRFYRVMRMTVKPYFKEGTAAGTILFTAWEPGTSTTAPTSIADFEYDYMVCQYISGGSLANEYRGANPPTLNVPRRALTGLQPWYLTDGDGTAENDTIGTMRFASDSASDDGTVKCLVRLYVQFKDAADPAVIGMKKEKREEEIVKFMFEQANLEYVPGKFRSWMKEHNRIVNDNWSNRDNMTKNEWKRCTKFRVNINTNEPSKDDIEVSNLINNFKFVEIRKGLGEFGKTVDYEKRSTPCPKRIDYGYPTRNKEVREVTENWNVNGRCRFCQHPYHGDDVVPGCVPANFMEEVSDNE